MAALMSARWRNAVSTGLSGLVGAAVCYSVAALVSFAIVMIADFLWQGFHWLQLVPSSLLAGSVGGGAGLEVLSFSLRRYPGAAIAWFYTLLVGLAVMVIFFRLAFVLSDYSGPYTLADVLRPVEARWLLTAIATAIVLQASLVLTRRVLPTKLRLQANDEPGAPR